MKKIAFLINKKIVYVDYQISTNKNAYLKITRNNKLLITAPRSISRAELIKVFAARVGEFLEKVNQPNSNILYSFAQKFVFWKGKKLRLELLTGYLKSKVKITSKRFYLCTASGNKNECEQLLKNYFNRKMYQYLARQQPLFEKKMRVAKHQIKVFYKFTTWGSNNLSLQTISYSSRLMHFQKDILDYVIVHELAHTLVPNHSPQFYNEIAKVIPNHKALQKKLRQMPCE